ncbi:toprim domain-containing protein [Spiroplasma endosymbiont of Polydrusus formosus]|uniref:toprim domain-containing protein n=1 Tax=Spiroplasma endosymbiont of Polydrusus formosus TaxID=3139326 RepID=UPI0035B52538
MAVFIIVEGKTDTTKLKSIFPEIKTIETSGNGITTEKLSFIKQISLNNKVIIFTDPDYPGQKLRQTIDDYFDNNYMYAFINKNDANKSDAIKGKNLALLKRFKQQLKIVLII